MNRTTSIAFLEGLAKQAAVENFVTSMGLNPKDLQPRADGLWVIPNGYTVMKILADDNGFIHIAIHTKDGHFVDRASFRKQIDNEWEEVEI